MGEIIKTFAQWISNHTYVMIILGGFVLAPITYFMIDSMENPERYNHK